MTRSKRWNGNIESLKSDYLDGVIGQMSMYGDRVQFALTTSGAGPHYQILNSDGKKMAFNGNHHLHHPEADEFVPGNATGIFTLNQIKLAKAGGGKPTRSSTVRATRAGAPRAPTAAARARDLIDSEKYDYFRNNRQTLPDTISEHSEEISTLMRGGMSVEQAFGEVIKRHF